jgi:hypothetical protein
LLNQSLARHPFCTHRWDTELGHQQGHTHKEIITLWETRYVI